MKVSSHKIRRSNGPQWDLRTKTVVNWRGLVRLGMGIGVILLAFGLLICRYVITERSHWRSRYSHWPQVPDPALFVTVQPKEADVVGLYELKSQTVTANGLAALAGRVCTLELRADGTFSVTNYPT